MKAVRLLGGAIIGVGFVLFFSMPLLILSFSPYWALMTFPSTLMIAVGVVLFKNGSGMTEQDFLPEQVFEIPSQEYMGAIPSDSGNGSGYCPGCGSPLSYGDSFCGVCGRRLRCRTGFLGMRASSCWQSRSRPLSSQW